jgi:hypothetical protein
MLTPPLLMMVLGRGGPPSWVPGTLAVYGDSTALGDGSDTTPNKWATLLSGDASLTLYNAGVSGQSMADMAAGVIADTDHRRWLTVFMDHANTGETVAAYIASLDSAASAIQTNRFLIWPQIGVTDGSDDATMLTLRSDINAAIIANWPNNTFDVTEQAAIIAALNDSTTRSDGVHRNDKGQTIEAFYGSAWLQRKGWRTTQAETTSLLARMTGAPTAKRQSYINALIERQKGATLWTTYDGFWLQAAHDEQAHTLNWVSTSYPLTEVGTVSFVADRGDTGDGSTGKMGTGFNPTTAVSPKYVQDSARITVYPVTDVAESRCDIGSNASASGACRLNTRNADNSISKQLNQASADFTGGGGVNKILFGLSRVDATNTALQRGASIGAPTANASVAPANQEVTINGGIGSVSTKQIASASIGSGVSATLATNDHYSRTAYLKAVGAL